MHSPSRKLNPSARPSVMKTLEKVKAQVEFDKFADLMWKRVDPLYNELCLIISEALILNPDSLVKLNGEMIYVGLVQEVFAQLRNEHLRLVFNNFQYVSYHVYNKKAYLRTALYNVFFEIESHHGGLGYY